MKESKDKQLEKLKHFIKVFAGYYWKSTRKKITSVEQVIDLIESGEYTMEDLFYERLDDLEFTQEESIHWEDNMQLFSYENFFPHSKEIESNSVWIKLFTATGFELHLAKKSQRQLRWNEVIRLKALSIENLSDRIKASMKRKRSTVEDFDKLLSLNPKLEELRKDYLTARIYHKIGVPLYEISIRRGELKREYYLPYQYELVDDIEYYTEAYLEKVPGVSIKKLNKGENADKIFYMQSRGIPKELAILLCDLRNTYLIVDLVKMTQVYNDQFRLVASS